MKISERQKIEIRKIFARIFFLLMVNMQDEIIGMRRSALQKLLYSPSEVVFK